MAEKNTSTNTPKVTFSKSLGHADAIEQSKQQENVGKVYFTDDDHVIIMGGDIYGGDPGSIKEEIIGQPTDNSSYITVYGARALANEKVASIKSEDYNASIDIQGNDPRNPVLSVRLSNLPGNIIQREEDGLYAGISRKKGNIIETLPSGAIYAGISKDKGNIIKKHEDGIFAAETKINISADEGNVIEKHEDGLFAEVKVSKSAGNQIQRKEDGLFVSPAPVKINPSSKNIIRNTSAGLFAEIKINDEAPRNLIKNTSDGLFVDVPINPAAFNIIHWTDHGLFAKMEIADKDDNLITKVKTGEKEGDGALYVGLSKDPGNAAEKRKDGLFVNPAAVAISKEKGNIIQLKKDGLFAVAKNDEYTIEKASDAGKFAAVYNLKKNGTNIGSSIEIPVDMRVKVGGVVDYNGTAAKIHIGTKDYAVKGTHAAGKYIVLVLTNNAEQVWVDINSIAGAGVHKVDTYTEAKKYATVENIGNLVYVNNDKEIYLITGEGTLVKLEDAEDLESLSERIKVFEDAKETGTLAAFNITDAYTKEETDSKLEDLISYIEGPIPAGGEFMTIQSAYAKLKAGGGIAGVSSLMGLTGEISMTQATSEPGFVNFKADAGMNMISGKVSGFDNVKEQVDAIDIRTRWDGTEEDW